MTKATITVKSQVYLVDGKEVLLDDVKVKVHEDGEGNKTRDVSYHVREVSREGSRYLAGLSFQTEKIQWIGRVIPLEEAA